MQNFYENANWEPNPYQSLNDNYSAVKEFYKLKHMLCLTDAERYVLKYRKPCPIEFDYISQLWQVKTEYKLTISGIAQALNIPRKTLTRILDSLEIPERDLKYKILRFMEDIKNDKHR